MSTDDLIVKKAINPTYGLFCPNLDEFLQELFDKATPEEREAVPLGLRAKVFKNFGRNANDLADGAKLWLLSVVFKRPVVLFIGGKDGDDKLLDTAGIKKLVKAVRGKVTSAEIAEDLRAEGAFALGDKQVMELMGYYRLVCTTDIYKLAVPLADRKTIKTTKFGEYRKAMKWMVRMFANYEANKVRMKVDYNISMPEWYALLYFYDSEKQGSSFYNDNFKYAQANSRGNMKNALTSLHKRGMLERRGKTNKYMYSITSKGEDIVQTIFEKIIYKFF